MRAVIQFFDSCPHWRIAEARLREVIETSGLDVDIDRQLVETPEEAERLGFRGSPSILIDGVDPFGEAPDVGLSCRIYRDDDGNPGGAPTTAQIAKALGV